MLDMTDSEIVMQWLNAALANKSKDAAHAADLARYCGVSAQAVNGWLKKGRISKSNLEKATQFFGHGPSFTAGTAMAAKEPAAPYGWPFRLVSLAEVERLPEKSRARIDKLIRARLDEWAEDSAPATAKHLRAQ